MRTRSRVRLGAPKGEPMSAQMLADFDWVRLNEAACFEQFGQSVILVFGQQVIGKGQTIDEAVLDAEEHLPADVDEVTPVLHFVSQPHSWVAARQLRPRSPHS